MTTKSTTSAEAIISALTDHPNSTAAELADAAGIGGSTASKGLATLEQDDTVVRQVGGRENGRRVADRWRLATETSAPASQGQSKSPGAAPIDKVSESTDAEASEGTRLHRGELSTLVLDHLKARAGEPIGPVAIAKALERSSGAVGNACQRLVDAGTIHLASSTPRRYQYDEAK
jgi:predicted transcriptional regulator